MAVYLRAQRGRGESREEPRPQRERQDLSPSGRSSSREEKLELELGVAVGVEGEGEGGEGEGLEEASRRRQCLVTRPCLSISTWTNVGRRRRRFRGLKGRRARGSIGEGGGGYILEVGGAPQAEERSLAASESTEAHCLVVLLHTLWGGEGVRGASWK